MTKTIKTAAAVLAVSFGCALGASAQTVQFITLSTTNSTGTNFAVQTNQVITIVGYDWASLPQVVGNSTAGTTINLAPWNLVSTQNSVVMSQITPELIQLHRQRIG